MVTTHHLEIMCNGDLWTKQPDVICRRAAQDWACQHSIICGGGAHAGPHPSSMDYGLLFNGCLERGSIFFSGEATDKVACVPVNNAPPMFMQVTKIKL